MQYSSKWYVFMVIHICQNDRHVAAQAVHTRRIAMCVL